MTKDLSLRKVAEEVAKETAKEAAKEAVKETFKYLGLDISNPSALQKDFHYLRDVRTGSDETKRLLRKSAISTFIIALITILLLGIKQYAKELGL